MCKSLRNHSTEFSRNWDVIIGGVGAGGGRKGKKPQPTQNQTEEKPKQTTKTQNIVQALHINHSQKQDINIWK